MSQVWLLLPVFVSLAVAGGSSAAPAGYLLVANKGDHSMGIVDPDRAARCGRARGRRDGPRSDRVA